MSMHQVCLLMPLEHWSYFPSCMSAHINVVHVCKSAHPCMLARQCMFSPSVHLCALAHHVMSMHQVVYLCPWNIGVVAHVLGAHGTAPARSCLTGHESACHTLTLASHQPCTTMSEAAFCCCRSTLPCPILTSMQQCRGGATLCLGGANIPPEILEKKYVAEGIVVIGCTPPYVIESMCRF